MPIFRPKLTTGEIYHIFNRGVEKRKIFSNQKDYFRFIHDLWEFNDKNAAINTTFYLDPSHYRETFSIVEGDKPERKPRDLLVEILCFALMPPTHRVYDPEDQIIFIYYVLCLSVRR